MDKKNCKIGVFDSGLGGVTVLKRLLEDLPYEEYIYYGDSGNAPYGSGKTKEEIQYLCKKIMDFLIENNCKVIVIACNTATVAALEYLKENYSIDILDSSNQPLIIGTFLVESPNKEEMLKKGSEIIKKFNLKQEEIREERRKKRKKDVVSEETNE